MYRRILLSTISVVTSTTVVLGIPLTITAWLWIEALARAAMQDRLERVATEIAVQEQANVDGDNHLDGSKLGLLIPSTTHLAVRYAAPDGHLHSLDLGEDIDNPALVETYTLGDEGTLTLSAPSMQVNAVRLQAVFGIGLAVLVSFSVGTIVAIVTARRIGGPMREVAERAARLTRGDYRPDPVRHGITELDRVSDVLDAATIEIAQQLQRERSLVSDVSHQLRSRLTAVRLRLDELASHADPEVVTEAEEAMSQVDRLTDSIGDLVRAARSDGSAAKKFVVDRRGTPARDRRMGATVRGGRSQDLPARRKPPLCLRHRFATAGGRFGARRQCAVAWWRYLPGHHQCDPRVSGWRTHGLCRGRRRRQGCQRRARTAHFRAGIFGRRLDRRWPRISACARRSRRRSPGATPPSTCCFRDFPAVAAGANEGTQSRASVTVGSRSVMSSGKTQRRIAQNRKSICRIFPMTKALTKSAMFSIVKLTLGISRWKT